MKRIVGYGLLVLVLASGAMAVYFHRFWYPGVGLEQPVQLWLAEHKFASPSSGKVKEGWPETFQIACRQTADCSRLEFHQQRKLAWLIGESDPQPAQEFARHLFASGSTEQKAIGAMLIAKHDRASTPDDVASFAIDSIRRSHPGLVRDRFDAADYLSEIGLLTLAYVGTSPRCAIVEAESVTDAPSYYKEAVNDALELCRQEPAAQ